MVLAEQMGIIDSETRWDEGITKAEAIEMLVATLQAEASISIFNYQQGTITGYEVAEDAEVNENTNPNDVGWGYEDEEAVEEETETEETTEGCRNTVPEDKIQWYLENLNLTREEFDQKTDDELNVLVWQWLEYMNSQSNPSTGNTGGSTGGGNNSGGNEDDPGEGAADLPIPELNPGDGSLPGTM